jgi:hypothetical protein
MNLWLQKEFIIETTLTPDEVKEKLQQVIETGPRYYGLFKRLVNKEFEGELWENNFSIRKGKYFARKIEMVINGTFTKNGTGTQLILNMRVKTAVFVAFTYIFLSGFIFLIHPDIENKWLGVLLFITWEVLFVVNFIRLRSKFSKECALVRTFFDEQVQ